MHFLSADTEKRLLDCIVLGDELAFTQIYNVYQPLLTTHIFRLTKSKQITDEIVQDVFLKIWTNRATLSNITSFKAYLGVAARNHALNALRNLLKERIRFQKLQLNSAAVFEADDFEFNNPSEHFKALDAAIDQLPPQQKKTYLLARHEGLKYAEIAEKLQLSQGTVKRYLQLANESISKFISHQRIKNITKILLLLIGLRS